MRTTILFSWDGTSAPLAALTVDQAPDFDIILFDYSGGTTPFAAPLPIVATIRQKTECKGQIYAALQDHLTKSRATYEYVALFDDDVEVTVSALNSAIALAKTHALDSFSLSLTPDSHTSHDRFTQRPHSVLRATPWVEVMLPFYRTALFVAGGVFYTGSTSSYGIDQFVMPTLGKVMNMNNVAVIDAHAARHNRPITSDGRVFANGLTARQERIILWQSCLERVKRDRADLTGTRWFYTTFAPLDGPVRFWTLYLGAPWHLIQRLVSGLKRRQEAPGMRHGPK